MSPEMANLYKKNLIKEDVDYFKDLVSYATDFYSLGILALEMLKGSPPFGYFRKDTDSVEDYLKFVKSTSDERIQEMLSS